MSHLRAVYLTGDHVYIRAMTKEDAKFAIAWFNSPFPINEASAEEHLKEAHGENQWEGYNRFYVIVRSADDRIVGGVVEKVWRVVYELKFHMAPWLEPEEADALRAEALGLIAPWERDERDAMAVATEFAADQPETARAAEAAGMRLAARLRHFIARPGHRVDLLLYEALNPRWEARNA